MRIDRMLTAFTELNGILFRVPPFLQTIEDPRAAQGGSLKGCPVCGGNLSFFSLAFSMPTSLP